MEQDHQQVLKDWLCRQSSECEKGLPTTRHCDGGVCPNSLDWSISSPILNTSVCCVSLVHAIAKLPLHARTEYLASTAAGYAGTGV